MADYLPPMENGCLTHIPPRGIEKTCSKIHHVSLTSSYILKDIPKSDINKMGISKASTLGILNPKDEDYESI